MLYLGCPLWANAKWKKSLFAADAKPADFLSHYGHFFNTAEGNTSFYADPSADTLQRWQQETPADFRFVLKVPRRISHEESTDSSSQLFEWLQSLAILGDKLAFIHLQLPARCGPSDLPRIKHLIAQINQFKPCALEVRHPAFFDKAQHEVMLHRMLQQLNAERVVIDSRALFAVTADTAALQEAQSKKPRLPVHAISFSKHPVLRFIGSDDMTLNRQFYQPWLKKIRSWLDEGKSPYCFFHTPDNTLAPELCRQFASDLGYSHICQQPWPGMQQISLL